MLGQIVVSNKVNQHSEPFAIRNEIECFPAASEVILGKPSGRPTVPNVNKHHPTENWLPVS